MCKRALPIMTGLETKGLGLNGARLFQRLRLDGLLLLLTTTRYQRVHSVVKADGPPGQLYASNERVIKFGHPKECMV